MAGSMPQGTNIPATNAQYKGGVAPSTPPTYNFTYDQARSRMMQQDVKSPAEIAAIKAALKTGPSTPVMLPSDVIGFSNGALPSTGQRLPLKGGDPKFIRPPQTIDSSQFGDIDQEKMRKIQDALNSSGFGAPPSNGAVPTPRIMSNSKPNSGFGSLYSGTSEGGKSIGTDSSVPNVIMPMIGPKNLMPLPARPQQPNIYQQASEGVTKAMQGAQAGMGFTPMAITAPTQQAIGQYMNPYESQVVGQSLADIERSRQMAQNVGSAQASAARALGGSRHGIAEAETNRAALEQAARTASSLRQSGFTQAQQLARQAQMQNQAAQLSGAQQRLSAGAQLGSLANLGFGMGEQIQDRMTQQGALQQALQQQLINAAKGQYAGYTGAPSDSLQYLLQAVGASPSPTTTTGTTNRGLFDYLALGLGVL